MRGRNEFTLDEIEGLKKLLRLKVRSNKQQQMGVRKNIRRIYKFYISDFDNSSKAFDEDQLDNLIRQGVIQIKDLNETAEEVCKPDKPEDLLSINREPTETTVFISEDSTGYSYKKLFYPYLKNAKHVTIQDPYIRKNHQIKNLLDFCMILDLGAEPINIKLITRADTNDERSEMDKAFKEIKKSLEANNAVFQYEYDETLHDRVIESDTGWRIKPGYGLDFYKRPDSRYSLEQVDQLKRKCKKTEIGYTKKI